MKHRAEAIKKASGVMFPEEVMSDCFFLAEIFMSLFL